MFKNIRRIALLGIVLALILASAMICFANDGEANEAALYGDVNGDGSIGLADVILLRKQLTIEDGTTLEGYFDVNDDGVVDLTDIAVLRQYLANYDFSQDEIPEDCVMNNGTEANITYTSGDGAVTSQYNGYTIDEYTKVCAYFARKGYNVYCSNTVGNLVSTTYTGLGDSVATVTFNGNLEELYVTQSKSGARALPKADNYVAGENDVTKITQVKSTQDNGMCYIITLADGSFIIIDGGYAEGYITDDVHKDDAKNVFETLKDLNGGSYDIYVRAWLITHSHGDHYQAFRYFANNYAQYVHLDTLLCSPAAKYVNNEEITGYDRYLTDLVQNEADKLGAEVAYVRTGMSLEFVGTTLEILVTPEQIYKNGDTGDFNDTSIVSRLKNDDGSMIFLGDCRIVTSDWLVETYGDNLKSNMVQMAHHGGDGATAELYDCIQAPTVFWPCNFSLMIHKDGLGKTVKQHVLEADYSEEHLLHDYGRITRELGYKPQTEYKNIMPSSTTGITGSGWTENIRFEDGVLRYDVKQGSNGVDPYIYFNVNIDMSQYNAIKLVVDPDDIRGDSSVVYFMRSNDGEFASGRHLGFRKQGTCAEGDDKMTIILYLGNLSTYTEDGKMTKFRIDLGDTVGQTIDIYSIEAYYVDVD